MEWLVEAVHHAESLLDLLLGGEALLVVVQLRWGLLRWCLLPLPRCRSSASRL